MPSRSPRKPRRTYYGTCSLCERRTSKAAMTRHLSTCAPGHDIVGGKIARLFRLRVEGQYDPGYWLDLEAQAHAGLDDLDRFLRQIWLECCGHLSAFRIGNRQYTAAGPFPSGMHERGMNERLSAVLGGTGQRFAHQYDFGSTTCLALRIVAEREGSIDPAPLRLLARNEPPVWRCSVCEGIANQICGLCVYEGDPFFCDEHGEQHPCGEEGLLPVVNSPRMGVCGYTGS